MNYNKYYDLEKYIYEEVHKNFNNRGYLTAEEFFCIVIWKANRAKTKIKRRLSRFASISEVVKEITGQLFLAESTKGKLDLLIKKWHFGLPMASAILSVLYPDEFTVYDYRVREQLGLKNIYSTEKYFEYFLPRVQAEATKYGITLREMDKELWGKSFYVDLISLLN